METQQTQDRSVIGHSATDKVVLFGGLPLLSLAIGFLLPKIADWGGRRQWVPFHQALELISRWDSWVVVAGGIVLGLVAGVLLAALALEDTLKVTITNQSVEFLKHQKTVTVAREKISTAFLDGKEIVLLDATSRELAREKHDQLKSDAKQIPIAFRAHGYPWSDAGDPYESRFRRWVEDEPDLPPAVNAVLKARSYAFDQEAKGKADLREFRDEIAKLGYTVKDKDKVQYWRETTP
jgi:hypothetical protein